MPARLAINALTLVTPMIQTGLKTVPFQVSIGGEREFLPKVFEILPFAHVPVSLFLHLVPLETVLVYVPRRDE